MSRILVLTDANVDSLVDLSSVIELVEAAFAADARGEITLFPVVLHNVADAEADFGIKASHLRIQDRPQVIGLKSGWFGRRNFMLGLPSHFSTILLTNPKTGEPLALFAGNSITTLRTAAGGAVAARYLARSGSSAVAVLGAGIQAYAQTQALRELFPIKHLNIWARRVPAGHDLAGHFSQLSTTVFENAKDAVKEVDIVITTTPSRSPLLRRQWLSPGTHVNAIGADAPGKRELDDSMLQDIVFVADKRNQSATIGEWQHSGRDADFAELGEICAGLRPGRTKADEITVFDSSGVSFQDLVLAGHLFDQALCKGVGRWIDI